MFFLKIYDRLKVFLREHRDTEKAGAVLIGALTLAVALLSNLYVTNYVQKFGCMGYAESLARSTPFSVYAKRSLSVAPRLVDDLFPKSVRCDR